MRVHLVRTGSAELNHPELKVTQNHAKGSISELIQLVDNTKSTSRFYGIKQYFFMILQIPSDIFSIYKSTAKKERQYSTVVSSSSSSAEKQMVRPRLQV